MENDRRKFLTFAGTVGIASLVLPGGVFAEFTPAEILSRDDYIARIKDWVYLHNADASHQGNLRLIKVLDRGSSDEIEQFALILRSRRHAVAMPSGYYQVAGEPFSLYVKHTHEKKRKQFYSAEFALLQ
jgi:hypothetical protein